MKKLILKSIFYLVVLVCALDMHAQNCNNGKLVINQNFSSYNGQNREYTLNMLNNDFPNVDHRTSGQIRGIGPGWPHETRVINGELRAQYLKNRAGGHNGGYLFDSSFAGTEEATLEYRVKFDKNFFWATGGKLPGLGGASTPNGGIPAGCTQNQNIVKNAFSLRLMWRRNRAQTQAPYLIVYPYLPNRTSRCGGSITFIRNINKNRWYTIKQYVKLNTPGQSNGILRMYVDGKLVLEQKNMLYRLAGKGNVKINSLVMHTYRGGAADDTVWHSPTTDYIYFDNFKVWTKCSGGGSDNSDGSISEGIYRFQNVATGQYMDSEGGGAVKVKNSNGNRDQEWALYNTSGGYYNIDSRHNGRGLLDTDPNGVVKWSSTGPTNNAEGFRWKPIKLSNGNYRFENRTKGRKYLRYNGTRSVIGYANTADKRSEWRLTRVGPLKSNLPDENENIEVSVYSNPTLKAFTIDLGSAERADIKIYNVTGQMVYNTTMTERQLTLQTGGQFKTGLHLIKMFMEDGSIQVKRVMIQ